MFSSDAGRRQLSSSAGFDRLVVVSLHRNHTYTDLAAIQAELSAKVMELAPPGFKPGTKVMILQADQCPYFSYFSLLFDPEPYFSLLFRKTALLALLFGMSCCRIE